MTQCAAGKHLSLTNGAETLILGPYFLIAIPGILEKLLQLSNYIVPTTLTPFDATRSLAAGVKSQDLLERLRRGLVPIVVFSCLGLVVSAVVFLATDSSPLTTTSMRITFAFSGYNAGEYPDHSKFQPEDIIAANIVSEALRQQKFEVTAALKSKILAALDIEGVIPPEITLARDRIRASGQTPTPFIPDEYLVTLTLPYDFPLSSAQREMFLADLFHAYQQNFRRTYTEIPMGFGKAFEFLRRADYPEYELILNREIQNIIVYLNQQLDQAKTFRSPTTNLSFGDLIAQTELFSEVRLNEVLGYIRRNGLSKNRDIALLKINYALRNLQDQERQDLAEQNLVDDLLAKLENQNNVLGTKSEQLTPTSSATVLDQGLIDSLLANDSSNYLIHQALEMGLRVKRIQAEKARLIERRTDLEAFQGNDTTDKTGIRAQLNDSLSVLEVSYRDLISNIRRTQTDFAQQQFAAAIQIVKPPETSDVHRPLEFILAVGSIVGFSLGLGLVALGFLV